jgi:hypothetical protein
MTMSLEQVRGVLFLGEDARPRVRHLGRIRTGRDPQGSDSGHRCPRLVVRRPRGRSPRAVARLVPVSAAHIRGEDRQSILRNPGHHHCAEHPCAAWFATSCAVSCFAAAAGLAEAPAVKSTGEGPKLNPNADGRELMERHMTRWPDAGQCQGRSASSLRHQRTNATGVPAEVFTPLCVEATAMILSTAARSESCTDSAPAVDASSSSTLVGRPREATTIETSGIRRRMRRIAYRI